MYLSADTVHAPDPDAKFLVASVEEALRLGADAVSFHADIDSREESRQITAVAAVAGTRWCDIGVPMRAGGPRSGRDMSPKDPARNNKANKKGATGTRSAWPDIRTSTMKQAILAGYLRDGNRTRELPAGDGEIREAYLTCFEMTLDRLPPPLS